MSGHFHILQLTVTVYVNITVSMGSTDLKYSPFSARATATPATPFQLRDERQQPDVPAPKAEHHLVQGQGLEGGRNDVAGFVQTRGRLLCNR